MLIFVRGAQGLSTCVVFRLNALTADRIVDSVLLRVIWSHSGIGYLLWLFGISIVIGVPIPGERRVRITFGTMSGLLILPTKNCAFSCPRQNWAVKVFASLQPPPSPLRPRPQISAPSDGMICMSREQNAILFSGREQAELWFGLRIPAWPKGPIEVSPSPLSQRRSLQLFRAVGLLP